MNNPDYRVLWVHGISPYDAGYSIPWEAVFNSYLNFPNSDYLEVLWSTVFKGENTIPLTPQEQLAANELRNVLATPLLARATAQLPGSSILLREWPSLKGVNVLPQDAVPDWVLNPDAYIGEFTEYLASRRIRNAVKEKMKEKLRPLAGRGNNISIIAHSWGTVVAYESLIDLEAELPTFKLRNLFTLGSPLWMVHLLLDDRSGRKPANTSMWVNVHALGDPIGAGLRPGFQVDKDLAVPSFGNDPHESYFVAGNVAVQRDIVKVTILVA
jgi:hypothetical protein